MTTEKKAPRAKGSKESSQDNLKQIFHGVPLPAGVTLDTDEERLLWDQFTRARIEKDWRVVDLLMVVKLVKCEATIRKHERDLDRIGPVVETPRGGVALNPLFSAVDMLQRKQLAIVRCLSLTVLQASEAGSKNGKGKSLQQQATELEQLMQGIGDEGDGLLAVAPGSKH